MKKHNTKMKGKKALSMLLVLIMVLTVASPAFSQMFGITAKAAESKFEVELGFNNLFLFEKWANNSLSSTVIADGVPNKGGTLDTDIENGSFRLTKTDMTAGEIYTAFSMGTESASQNVNYYSMPVEPNTTYTFSYNVEGNIWSFTPFVFMYTDEGLFAGLDKMVFYGTPGYGNNSFEFTTPENVTSIQIRFTIGDNSNSRPDVSSVYADVKDIAIYKTELLESYNLFDLQAWASNTKSATTPDASKGSVEPNVSDGSIKFENVSTGYLWSGFGIDPNVSNDAYYTMNVKAGTTYTLTYDIVDQNLLGPIYLQPFIVEMDENGKCLTYYPNPTANYIGNKWSFTTRADTVRIQLVFALITDQDNYVNSTITTRYATVKNIGVYETSVFSSDFATVTGHDHRQYYPVGSTTYGELPTPSYVPEGMVFAGWYTGENGDGMRINSDTAVHYSSLTVYPKFEPKVDSLTVTTPPTKTNYTVGEKLNTAGLVLTATQQYTVDEWTDKNGNDQVDEGETETKTHYNTFNITSGYYCTPEYLTTVGTQTITANYGGKTVTFNVDVSLFNEKTLPVNDTEQPVQIANNVYTLNYTAPEAFNRYEITYYSDSYVKGTITMADGTYEDFFLEPSTNGSFASYIDDYFTKGTYDNIESIGFVCLDKEYGNFELYSVETIKVTPPSDTMAYYENDEYKVGLNLAWGGVLAYLLDKEQAPVAATYADGITRVNYSDMLPSGATSTSNSVNLINTYDKGRYVQQSYYGTAEAPYVMGDYNGMDWNYNPIQGGNIAGEGAKVVDYRITGNEVYVKTRPLEWAKWSDEGAEKYNTANPGSEFYKEKKYEDSYNPWAYMESWYVFEDGMIKSYCRFVDYSGLPSATVSQELPAFYCIEPLNDLVYYAGGEAWNETNTVKWASDLDFWGATPEYNEMLIANGKDPVDSSYECNESWAAFMAGTTNNDYGIGIYSAGVTEFKAGSYMSKYKMPGTDDDPQTFTLQEQDKAGRYADTLDPATEDPTSYIAPLDTWTMESYKAFEYSYYITTGTQEKIREDFKFAVEKDTQTELDKTKIAVPETVYMTPASGASTVGQYYVNNVMDENDNYNIKTEAARDKEKMYLGLHVKDATEFSVKVTNVTDPANDIYLCNTSGSEISESTRIPFGAAGTYEDDHTYGLRFSGAGLQPGEIATAKWEITVYLEDGSTETYTAYTVMYAPGRTVGAVAEARQVSASQHEISSWITGANGVDHSKRAPLGSLHGDYKGAGYFRQDPLTNENAPGGGSGGTTNDYIEQVISGVDVDNNVYNENTYVMQTATNDHDGSRAHSYLGLLTVDKSRYTNTDQIPNLRIGYDVLRIGSYVKNSLGKYTTYYTLGNESAYTATSLSAAPSGWTVYSGTYTDFADNHDLPYRESFVPSFAVSDIDGKYIHALNQGIADQTINTDEYATAGTSVLCSVTDKSELRDSVLNSYTLAEEKYPGTTSPEFTEALEEAATILGDPSASQDEIDEAKKELNEITDKLVNVFYALKYDNLFSAYEYSQKSGGMTVNGNEGTISYSQENSALTITNTEIADTDVSVGNGNNPDVYYNIDVKGSTKYVFEYDLDSVGGSQMHLFFYDNDSANPQAWLTPTGKSYTWTPEGGSSRTVDQTANTDPFACVYAVGEGHVVMRFTTPADADRVSFRFGNTNTTTSVSTFSNIRFIEADKYYADATYSKTEDVYNEYQSYGTLITPVRTGYTFNGWKDANGVDVTGADIATEHKSIYSQWDINQYTITYDANGGSVSPTSENYTVETTLNIPTPTRGGYTFTGWKVTESDGSWTVDGICQAGAVPAGMYGNVKLTAQWTLSNFPVMFDTILDFSKWDTATANNATISNVTSNGFTLTSAEGAGEGTTTSPEFPVTPGKQYYIDVDIDDTLASENWDVYIFFYGENESSGTGIGFTDSGNRFAANGDGNASRTFTAPAGAVKAVIRLDANGASHAVTFSDIRVYEVGTCASDVYVPYSSKDVTYGDKFGELPVPTREGYDFVGWYDAGGNKVTADDVVSYTQATTLYSKWEMNDTALEADTVVIDFDLPVAIDPLANDTIFMAEAEKEGNSYKLNGISSTENGNYSTSLTGTYGEFAVNNGKVTFTPNKTIDGVVTLYYSVTITADSKDTTLTESITIAPASNVYYEETVFEKVSYGTADWSTVEGGTSASYSDSTDAVYGFDNTYNNTNTYSNGKTLFTAVDSTNKLSKGQNVKFVGAGIDIISACGPTTGIQIIDIKDAKTGKYVATGVVDTYYADATFSQVPIFSWRGDYGEYIVETSAAYLSSAGALKKSSIKNNLIDTGLVVNSSDDLNTANVEAMLEAAGVKDIDTENLELVWFDDNSVLNGGTGVAPTKKGARAGETESVTLNNYLDGFRVYNPLGSDSSAYDVGEQGAVYHSVIDSLALADGTLSDGSLDFASGTVAFVAGSLADGETLSFANYESVGPKNELYLQGGATTKGLFFKTPVADGGRVMISLRAVNGPTTVSINGSDPINVTSATEMYYDITGLLTVEDGAANVTIINTGSGILAVNNIKLTNTVSASGLMPLGMEDLETVQYYASMEPVQVSVKDGVITPVVIEDDIPDDGTNTGNNDTTTDNEETEESFSIFSLIEALLAFIKEILFNTVGSGNLF